MSYPSYELSPSEAFVKFFIPESWCTIVNVAFKKDQNQALLINSNVENGSALFQSEAIVEDGKQNPQLECAETFYLPAQSKPTELSLALFHPKHVNAAQPESGDGKGERYKLIYPESLSPKATVLTCPKPYPSANEHLDRITYFVFVENQGDNITQQNFSEAQRDTTVVIVNAMESSVTTSVPKSLPIESVEQEEESDDVPSGPPPPESESSEDLDTSSSGDELPPVDIILPPVPLPLPSPPPAASLPVTPIPQPPSQPDALMDEKEISENHPQLYNALVNKTDPDIASCSSGFQWRNLPEERRYVCSAGGHSLSYDKLGL